MITPQTERGRFGFDIGERSVSCVSRLVAIGLKRLSNTKCQRVTSPGSLGCPSTSKCLCSWSGRNFIGPFAVVSQLGGGRLNYQWATSVSLSIWN